MFKRSRTLRSFTLSLCVVSLATLTLPPWTFGQQGQVTTAGNLTLPQAVEIALQTNPLTRASAARRNLAVAELKEARSGRWPLLRATETFTNSNNPVFVFGSLLEQGRFGVSNFAIDSLNNPSPLSNFRSAVTLNLPIFDQRQTETKVKQAQIKRQQADQATDLVEQQLRFEVVRSFYNILLCRAHVAVADEAVKTAEADIKRARDLFETGVTVHSDLLAAEVQLSEFRQQRVQANGELTTAFAALNTALGLPISTPQILSGELIERTFDLEPLDVLTSDALRDRPEYKQALSMIESGAAQLRGARGEWLPRLDAFASTGASSHHFIGGSSDYTAGASLTFNVFDAGRKTRIDQARANESIARAESEQLANQIRFEVVRAYQQYTTARERLVVVATVSAQASETLRIVQDRYHAGLTTITELLRAETSLVRARTDVLAARYDQYIGYASVLLAAGNLKDVSQFSP